MDVKNKVHYKKRRKHTAAKAFIFFVMLSALALTIFTAYTLIKTHPTERAESKPSNASSQVSSVVSEPEFVNTYATVISTGDIMVHEPQLDGAYVASTGKYDFSDIFVQTESYFKAADLAVANLEVTFAGNDGRNYSGYPVFNCPDGLANAIKKSGLNLILTANNHSYDTGLHGFMRTQKVLKKKGIEYTGTRTDKTTKPYVIKEINGIKIGIADFTYETEGANKNRKYLNGILLSEEAAPLINSFSYPKIEEFYETAGAMIEEMKQNGAEFTLFYIHWGDEYKTEPNSWQKNIAQQLSNRGLDMIIGSHPHVIEPIELVHSEGGDHTTVCLYSTGNAVSNQRQERMDSCPSGHTEDGLLISFTLEKSEDGVSLCDLDIIPTWVDKFWNGSGYRYTIYPLEKANDAANKYKLSDSIAARAKRSYNRTVEIVAKGLTKCQKHIGCDITFKNSSKEDK